MNSSLGILMAEFKQKIITAWQKIKSSSRPRVIVGCLAILILLTVSYFLTRPPIDEAQVIHATTLKQTSTIVAGGAPIKWSVLVRRSDITEGNHLLKLPSGAEKIKIQNVTAGEAKTLLAMAKQAPVPLSQRVALASGRGKSTGSSSLLAGIGVISSKFSQLTDNIFIGSAALSTVVDLGRGDPLVCRLFVSFLKSLGRFFGCGIVLGESIGPDGGDASAVISSTDAALNPSGTAEAGTLDSVPASAPEVPASDVSSEPAEPTEPAPAEAPAEVPQDPAPALESPSSSSSTTETQTVSSSTLDTATSSAPASAENSDVTTEATSTEFVKVDYETPAPIITEEKTDTGKLVTISDPNEAACALAATASSSVDSIVASSSEISASSTSIGTPEHQAEATACAPLTDVLASTKIPKIYKVGQENRIKIKWQNNGDQNMTFQAYDTDSDGYLDYVEWTVPHLSDQIFNIIFISKAFQLDADKNILADIYPQVQAQDGTWATVPDGNYVRFTFEAPVNHTKNIDIYARPATAGTGPDEGVASPVTIEVYPVYTDADGNQTEGPLVATFPVIDREDTYHASMANLGDNPTDVFDFKIIDSPSPAGLGTNSTGVEFDYVQDGTNVTAVASGNWNTGATWDGGAVPGDGDTVYLAGFTVTLDTDTAALGPIYSGTVATPDGAGYITASASHTITATTIQAGTGNGIIKFTGASGQTLTINATSIVGGSGTSAYGIWNSSTGAITYAGTVTGGSAASAFGVYNSSSGTVTITGNVAGGTVSGSAYGVYNGSTGLVTINGAITGSATTGAVYNSSTGTINVTIGPVTGGSGTNIYGIYNVFSGPVNITGNVVGGSGTTAYGIYNNANAILNITGNVVGGSGAATNYGVRNNATSALVTITGNVTGGSVAASNYGVYNSSSGPVTINGAITGSDTATAVHNASTGTITVTIGPVTGGSGTSIYGISNNSSGPVNITGNVVGGSGTTAYGVAAISVSSGNITITGDVTGGTISATAYGVINNSATAIITITGNVTGSATTAAYGVYNTSTGSVTINGAITGSDTAIAVRNNSTGTITVTIGPVTGGSGTLKYGIYNSGNAIVNITGNVVGGSGAATNYGIYNGATSALLTITGNVTGGSVAATNYGVYNYDTGPVTITGDITPATAVPISNVTTGTITLSGTGNQTVNFGGAMGYVIVNKPTSGDITWTSGDTITFGGAWNMVNLTIPAGVILDSGSGLNYVLTLSGNFVQSSITSKFLARSSVITVNGNGTFTADGTVDPTQYNSASLVLNGTNTLTYVGASYINGFGNLTVGQGGLTTTLAGVLAVKTLLTVGSGTLSSANTYMWGTTPLSVDASSNITGTLRFNGTTQTIPALTNGYNCNIFMSGSNTVVTQTGNVTLNSTYFLNITANVNATGIDTWKTDGYNLTVGGYLQIGAGADTGLKKLDATNYTNPNPTLTSTITVGGNWLNYGTGSAPSQFVADNSTVILTGTGASGTITSGSSINPNAFYNLTQNGAAGTYTLQDNATVGGALTVTAGILAVGTYNLAVTGNSTVNANLTMGASGGTGWTTGNLTIGAGGIVTANGTYYNQVTVSGTLNPDATGTYTYAGTMNGVPYYRRGSDNYWVFSTAVGADYNYVTYGAIPTTNPDRWARLKTGTIIGTYAAAGTATGIATVANVTASGFIPSKVTISGNYDQSSITSKFLAYGSLITVNGNGTFTADGTLDSTQYNSASLALNGVNTLTYGNLATSYSNGFNNLTTGQGGNTTTISQMYIAVRNVLTVGSGTLAKTSGYRAIYLLSATPLSVDANSRISITVIDFIGTGSKTIPSLINGYDSSIYTSTGSVIVTQTGNIVINGANDLVISADTGPTYVNTWKTDGYNLTVGRNLQIGAGADTGLKKLDATNYTNPDPAAKSTITVGGNWLNYGNGTAPSQFVAATSTVVLTGTGASGTITSGSGIIPNAFYNLTQNGSASTDTYTLQDALTVSHNLTLTTGVLDTKSGSNYAVTIGSANPTNGDFSQATTAKFLARSSTITVNGNGIFTADGTLDSTQYNSASLVLNGTNTLTYNTLGTPSANGFNNLTVGGGGLTTTLASTLTVGSVLTIGSGTLTGGSYNIYFLGANPFSFNASSYLSIGSLYLYRTGSQNIPALANGYDSNIQVFGADTVTQTGDIILNTTKYLYIIANVTSNPAEWKTDGYNLTVGGNLTIGRGADTGLKKLDATRNGARTSTITVGGNWLNYGNGTAPSVFTADNSTVILNSTASGKTITSGATNSAFYNLIFNGTGGAWTLQDNLAATGALTHTAGTLSAGGKNITTTGNLTISDGALVTASGLVSTVYYNQVTVSGTMSPDATGTYTYAGVYGGYPYYRRGADAYYIWYDYLSLGGGVRWRLSTALASVSPMWRPITTIGLIASDYTGANGATGIVPVANVTASGFIGSTITVGGAFSASGHSGALLTLNPASAWYLNVAGTAAASYVNAAYSNASGGTLISQTNSTDGGNNTHWGFDLTPPTVSTVAVQTSLTVNVTFSEPMGTGVTTAGNYTISGAGKGTLAANPTSVALSSGNTYTLTWATGEMLNGGDVTITVVNAQDVAGNAIAGSNAGTHTGGGIGVAPVITITNPDTTAAQSKTITAVTDEGTLTMSNTTGATCNGTLTFVAYGSQTFITEADNAKKVCYQAVDAAGNTAYSLSNAIGGIDVTAPVISNISPVSGADISKTGQAVTFTLNKTGDCRVAVGSAKSYDGMAGDTACAVANSIQMTCILPTLDYGAQNLYFACEDYLGNKDTAGSATHMTYTVPAPHSSVGGSIRITFPTIAPVAVAPTGPFSVVINNGATTVNNNKVTLKLAAGADTTAVVISTNPDFSDAVIVPFQTSLEYDLCRGSADCLDKNYTVYVKFLSSSGTDSPAFSSQTYLKITSLFEQTSKIVGQIGQGLFTVFDFFASKQKEAINFPPINTSVPENAPPAFQKKVTLTPSAMQNFVFASLPKDFLAVAQKFPQVASTLKQVGVTRMGDAGQLEVAKISLPGLAEVAGLPTGQASGLAQAGSSKMPNIAIADMSAAQTGKVPSNIVFAQAGENNLDLSVKLSISNQGTAVQTLNTIQGHPLTLAIKPDQKAAGVKGYLIFKSSQHADSASSTGTKIASSAKARNLVAAVGNAVDMKASVNVGNKASAEDKDLVLTSFDYQDSGNGIWTADVASPLVLGQYELRTVVNYANKKETPKTISMVVVVDPEGYVYRKLGDGSEARVTGASVAIYWLNPATKNYELWPAGSFRQENPQATDVTGRYAFLVPPGDYYLTATAPAYGDYKSAVFKVEENKGVFMNIELKAKISWASLLNLQTILLGGIFLFLAYFAVLFTRRRKSSSPSRRGGQVGWSS